MAESGILFSADMVLALLNTEIGSWPPKPINPAKPCKGATRRLSKQWLKVKAGDRLWVRETWAWPGEEFILYRADPEAQAIAAKWATDKNYPQVKWIPSIHMPRRVSRVLLEATEDAREERLQDITEDEAILEGIERRPGNYLFRDYSLGDQFVDWTVSAIKSYASLWGSLHPKPGARWEDNPSLVRLAFRRLA